VADRKDPYRDLPLQNILTFEQHNILKTAQNIILPDLDTG